jgi:exopolyphosphatase / guanosine-5'-triphosphate,3'-diphosphate pyrophosphatase
MQEKDETMVFITKTAQMYDPDPSHSEQVATLALALFTGLGILHGYGSVERHLLEIASRLHDIGWSRTATARHHKHTFDMIQELDIPGLEKQEQFLCALIARYHTKALPDASRHSQFSSLDPDRRELVEWLAGILRVADGLDSSHTGRIKKVTCEVEAKTIKVSLEAAGDCRMELEKACKKQELLIRKTGRELIYQCL